jgi:prophage antirepressor-like protein
MSGLEQVARHRFGDMEVDIWQNDNNEIFMTSEQIGSALDYAFPAESIRKIRDRFPERFEGKSVQVVLTSTDGKHYATRVYNEQGIYEVIRKSNQPKADEFYDWVYGVLHELRTTGSYNVKPKSGAEFLVEMAQQLLNQERQMTEQQNQLNEFKAELQVTTHRIDSLDNVDIIGDKQQRLNGMLRRYAGKSGVKHDATWKEFTQRYNTAYHTNLKALMDNYKERHGLRELTRPQYFSLVGQLDDAIRVADKMLNRVPVGV